jgi:hypothetical protein
MTLAGACRCFKGYAGQACTSCTREYTQVGQLCVYLPGSLQLRETCMDGNENGFEVGVDCGGPFCESCTLAVNDSEMSSRSSLLTTAQLSAVIVSCIILVAMVAVFCCRHDAELKCLRPSRWHSCQCCRTAAFLSGFSFALLKSCRE